MAKKVVRGCGCVQKYTFCAYFARFKKACKNFDKWIEFENHQKQLFSKSAKTAFFALFVHFLF